MATVEIMEHNLPLVGLSNSGAYFADEPPDMMMRRPVGPAWELAIEDWRAMGRPVDLKIRVETRP